MCKSFVNRDTFFSGSFSVRVEGGVCVKLSILAGVAVCTRVYTGAYIGQES